MDDASRFKRSWAEGFVIVGLETEQSCSRRLLFVKRSVLQTAHVWHVYPSVNSTLTLMLTETC